MSFGFIGIIVLIGNKVFARIFLINLVCKTDGAIRLAHKIYQENPGKYFIPDQYNNPDKSEAHYETTGVEILQQTKGAITHFVATMGTSGTVMGITRRLKEHNSHIVCIGAQPAHAMHGLEGLKHMPTSIVPGIYHEKNLDEE